MTTIQGRGPAVRLVQWLNANPPPERWTASELLWARAEMPLAVMLDPAERWPGPLAYLQAAFRRGELVGRFHQARERLESLPRFSAAPHRGLAKGKAPGGG